MDRLLIVRTGVQNRSTMPLRVVHSYPQRSPQLCVVLFEAIRNPTAVSEIGTADSGHGSEARDGAYPRRPVVERVAVIRSRAAGCGGAGRNAERGTGPAASQSKCRRPGPGVPRRTMSVTSRRCSSRSAATSRLPGAVSIRMIGFARDQGGLATTRKGRAGSRKASRSRCSTVTVPTPVNRRRSCSTRPGCSSTASTRAPAAARAAEITPSPAPRSTTSCPGRIRAPSTRVAAQSGCSRCHPQNRCCGWDPGGRCCPAPGTTHHDHHRHHGHDRR